MYILENKMAEVGKVLLLVSQFIIVSTTYAMQCNRIYFEGMSAGHSLNDRYTIEILENPKKYTPEHKYTVALRSTNLDDQNKFINFTLFIKSNDIENMDAGNFQLLDHPLAKFHDQCPNAITQTNSIPKSEIQVYWVAPPSKSGCVDFKAIVEDNILSRTLCENSEDIDNSQPPVLKTCCACHEAKYEMTFESLWSRNTHPKDFPPNNFMTKFSDIIGATHSVNYKFWEYGGYASDGLKELAEHGNTKQLETELKDKSEHIRTIIKARGISYPNITGKTFAMFRVDERHHLMSLVSMIHPSPDWIVGVSSLEMCLQNCSWVESKILNLFPWDAGTDNGTTYLAEDSPISPREPIRRITTKSPSNSPFYDENGTEMKPLARLILSRQRLFEKHNCQRPDDQEPANLKEYCALTEWQEWSPCNVPCGQGTRHRQRTYKMKVADQHKQKETCRKQLTGRSTCYGAQRECPATPVEKECELTSWEKWSECSVTCGNGTKTRARRYKTREGAKHCQQNTSNPPRLEQNLACVMPPCDWPESQPAECIDRAWSEWSTCSVTCGKGTKMRRKLSINVRDLHKHNRISRSFEEEDDEQLDSADICDNVIERVECYNDDSPSCYETTTISALACTLSVDPGLCRSNIDRWYFNSTKGKCELFSYSGCEGNRNNFRTLEMCEQVCGEYQRDLIANRTFQKRQFAASIFGSSSHNMQPQNDQGKHENRSENSVGQDCVVSKWSHWSACSVSCGRGIKIKTRQILKTAAEGGKPCPDKLKKKKKCKVACRPDKDTDCEVSEWSPWSPCNHTCGPNSVQQRTRNVLQEPSGKGNACPERIEVKACNLSVCPDY